MALADIRAMFENRGSVVAIVVHGKIRRAASVARAMPLRLLVAVNAASERIGLYSIERLW